MMCIKKNMVCFGLDFFLVCVINGKYWIKKNDDWINGFWMGMFWLFYEWIKEEKFLVCVMENIYSF